MTKYTVDYFINKFSNIPEELWLTGDIGSTDKHCVLGHCGNYFNGHTDVYTSESDALDKLFGTLDLSAIAINDGWNLGHFNLTQLGDTPKQRILAALELIKAGVRV